MPDIQFFKNCSFNVYIDHADNVANRFVHFGTLSCNFHKHKIIFHSYEIIFERTNKF